MKVLYFTFKTSAIFLDDQELFLDSVQALFSDRFDLCTTSSIDTFLKFINTDIDLESNIIKKEDGTEQEAAFSVDLSTLCQYVLREGAKKPISVAFIDYHMPQETGLEVALRIKNPYVKKVLFTGELDADGGIEALNTSTIDAYLKKTESNIEKKLSNMFISFSQKYLENATHFLAEIFDSNTEIRHVYSDPIFCALYQQYLNRNDFEAACIYDSIGSQVVRLKTHDVLLNVYSKDEIDNVLLNSLEEEDFQDIYKGLLGGKGVLDYKKKGSLSIPPVENWKNYYTENILQTEDGKYFIVQTELDQRFF